MIVIEQVTDETPTVRTLTFQSELSDVLPGQFAMVWIPGINELPMSVMISEREGRAAFTVRKHGPASTGLYNLNPGDMIGVRGPYGNSFDVRPGRLLLVGGGTGLVPMMRLAASAKAEHITLLIGAKTRNEVFFESLAKRLLPGGRIMVSTDDGSYGEGGMVTGTADRLLGEERFDAVYVCGPEIMMYKVVESARSRGVFVQASLERMMKCGVGICGSCCTGEDLVCRDGTVFDGDSLASNKEFGHTYRDKAGILRQY
ncbi:MAG: dihydroorotate dehydrogenase electron transfer subunit [Nitrosopumilus sp. H13]|nr:MAG: dihydroorotate dehydrogenase electron transfer subunit [Nitrosopumilus sp. H13]